ncbi:FKBP-type peptidyl-prolyl cis-trans isomerase [Candidatus Saccharibacteria bacterium]|nr:FKBP-type peptidyl-prolyl cis-trans isomerase [Candidatus Saccharibacteria bacterium]
MIATEPTTSKKTRIAVIAIATLMIVSTGALFIGMALSSNNQGRIEEILLAERNAKLARLDELLFEFGEELNALAAETTERHFETFASFRPEVRSFVADNVNVMQVRILREGTGDPLNDISDENSILYLGWLANGTVFDSSFDIENPQDADAWRTTTGLRFPTRASQQFIDGFKIGMVGRRGGTSTGARLCTDGTFAEPDRDCPSIVEGMRIGEVREITIPFQLAYGESAFGNIPAMSPLRFIVMRVPFVQEPEPSDELFNLYMELHGQ